MNKNISIKLLVIMLALISFSCNRMKNSSNNIASLLTNDSLMNLTNQHFEIIKVELVKDTLLITSTKDFLYYPFGKYHRFNNFLLSHSFINKADYKVDTIGNDFKIINVENKNNSIQFTEDTDESHQLELVNATINTDEIIFKNNIKIGINQKEFLSIFFKTIPKTLEEIPIIELESGLTGIWHYYYFSNKKLEKISIKTDYVLEDCQKH